MTKKERILVIDDEAEMREMLHYALSTEGYDVDTACDGKEGIEKLSNRRYAVLITDIKMPGMDGINVLKRAKKIDPELQIIIMTGYASIESAINALQEGAFNYLNKPFDNITKVHITVKRAVEKRRLQGVVDLYEVSKDVFLSLDPEHLYPRIVLAAMRALAADDASLMLHNEEGQLVIVASHGLSEEIKETTRLNLGERVAGYVASTGKAEVFIGSVADDARFENLHLKDRKEIKSSIVYPLQLDAMIFGVLNINRTTKDDHFQPSDLHKTAIFASLVTLALENSRLYKQLASNIKRLEDTQIQLVQSEKLASVGQLAAGIAHEINNPVGFITSNLGTLAKYVGIFKKLLAEYKILDSTIQDSKAEHVQAIRKRIEKIRQKEDLAAILDDVGELLSESKEGATRVKEIVQGLQSFARIDQAQLKEADINEGIEATLKIIWNELKYKCKVHKSLEKIPKIRCYPSQLNQVFMNLLMNAAQAIPERGNITIETKATDTHIIIRISDTGTGIPPEHLAKLFDPFFTTKEVGKGTGLGLSISHGIVQMHNGTIEVESEVDKGTTFTIHLPLEGIRDE